MSSSIDINGKKLLPISEASKAVGYSRDYITRLARERKVVATQIGRKWFVDIKSLKSYSEVIHSEQEIKKRHLSLERKHELAMREAKARKLSRTYHRSAKQATAVLTAIITVVTGIGLGFVFEAGVNSYANDLQQVAVVSEGVPQTPEPDFVYSETVESFDGEMLTVDFAPNVSHRSLSQEHAGLVLLSESGTTSAVAVEEYFSDPVKVMIDEEGNEVLVRVDGNGNPVGQTFPFVVVPVNTHSP